MSQVTEDHVRQYKEEGYCHVEGLIPPELMAAAFERVLEIVEDPPDWQKGRFHLFDPDQYQAAAGVPLPKGLQRPGLEEEAFAQVAEHDNLKQAMAGVLGGDVELFTDQIGIKHGWVDNEQGGRSYFHQDSWYWKIDPELGCNCWIPFSDVGKDEIALSVMPGSQADWVLTPHESYFDDPPMFRKARGEGEEGYMAFKRHRIPFDAVDYDQAVRVDMKAGDGLFFTNYTWHQSEPNRTGETRGFYAIAYQLKSNGD